MNQKSYSAYRLAKILGVNNQSVLNWQHGGHLPHTKTRIKIAQHFGITLEELDGDDLPVLPEDTEAVLEKSIKKDLPQGEVDAITQALLDFAINGTSEQKEDALQYIQFLKSKRGKD